MQTSLARKPVAVALRPEAPAGMGWADAHADIASLAERQLFFVGGAPRSGTTWLQQCLNTHPDMVCAGEGLFQIHLANPLQKLMAERAKVIAEKNANIFGHTGGYALPNGQDTDALIGTAILLAMRRQHGATNARAIGEKTPENAFFFPHLARLFPAAKFIGIARDPRDVLASSWHFFAAPGAGPDEAAAKIELIRISLPSIVAGAHAMLDFAAKAPDRYRLVTYETLRPDPAPHLAALFRFLGVSDSPRVVADVVAATSFAAMANGRPAGVEQPRSFFRKGVVGDWRSTFTEAMGDMILQETAWMFPHFGWTP